MNNPPIKPKDKSTIIQALRAGVVPRTGLQHIQVGRADELAQLLKDIELIADGGSSFRLVVGEYGAGKTFFLNIVRIIALEKKLLVMNADLSPDRRLHATGGQARNLFSELTRNLATRTKADGGALPSLVEKFVSTAIKDAENSDTHVETLIDERLSPLEDFVSGYDLAHIVKLYMRSSLDHDDEKKAQALRWLRAEYPTRTDAKREVGVRSIIDDANIYDYMKLYSAFAKISGYNGLLIILDEMVNLYKLTSAQARSSNFEQLLRMLNDVLQGHAENIGFILGGTPEFLMDTRRGLYSYEALQSRLAENTFAKDGVRDISGPVIRLQNLSPEELYALLLNVTNVFASGNAAKHMIDETGIKAFMQHCQDRIGSSYFQTPRTSIKAFVDLLSVLEQNPERSWRDFIDSVDLAKDIDPNLEEEDGAAEGDDELTSFRL